MNTEKLNEVAYKLFLQVRLKLMQKYTENVIERFFYICAEHSEMKTEFDDLLRQFRELRKSTTDHRVKFTKEDIRRIRKVYRTSGNYSITRTKKLLKNEDIEISERYLYMIVDDIRKERNRSK